MPMEFGLELMAVIRPDFTDAERELFSDVVGEVDGVGLGMFFLDFQCPDACGVINGCVLKAAYLFAFFPYECQELNIHLNMMPWNLLLIALGMNFAHSSATRKAIEPMAAQDT